MDNSTISFLKVLKNPSPVININLISDGYLFVLASPNKLIMSSAVDFPSPSFYIFAAILIVLVILIILANIFLQENADWKSILTDLLNDILSVAIVGVIATLFTKRF